MPIKKKPGPKGGFVATYGGKSRTFKTRAAAEKWAAQYKTPVETAKWKARRPRTRGKSRRPSKILPTRYV